MVVVDVLVGHVPEYARDAVPDEPPHCDQVVKPLYKGMVGLHQVSLDAAQKAQCPLSKHFPHKVTTLWQTVREVTWNGVENEFPGLADYSGVVRIGADEQAHTSSDKEVEYADEGYDLHSNLINYQFKSICMHYTILYSVFPLHSFRYC